LASSRLSSNTADVIDVAAVIKAFEEINTCCITVFGRVEPVQGLDTLTFLVSAIKKDDTPAEDNYLASVKCYLGSLGHRTMESAIMWALYQLDWRIAQNELERIKPAA